jgi:CHAP domain/Galactose oxidase, central domain/Kelch motif
MNTDTEARRLSDAHVSEGIRRRAQAQARPPRERGAYRVGRFLRRFPLMALPHPALIATLACVAALFLAFAAAPASTATARKAAASYVGVKLITNGGDNRLDVLVRVHTARPRIACVGTATQRDQSAHLPRLRTGSGEGAQWHWYVGNHAPRANLTIHVRCLFPGRKSHTARTARRVGPGPNLRSAFRGLIKPGSLKVEKWVPKPHNGSGGHEELYPSGQCTWYVAKRRPDLPYFPGTSGDAKNWTLSAQKRKIPTGVEPRVGAVAVFAPGQYSAGFYGHVAYVTEVYGDRIKVAEANYLGRAPSTRTTGWRGISFIYRVGDEKKPSPPRPPRPPLPLSLVSSPAASMTIARAFHAATLLKSGKVLVSGGRQDGSNATSTPELYDPDNNTWSAAVPNMTSARMFHTATRLDSGKVLVTGGQASLGLSASASAELYDPVTNTWAEVPNMTSARVFHTATLLESGKVLVTGGVASLNSGASATNASDLYDPVGNTWLPVPGMTSARVFHTATRLNGGRVLVTGGQPSLGSGANASAELYDPATNTWSPAQKMPSARTFHTATLLRASGKVLVAGGQLSGASSASASATAELYDDATNTWTAVPNMMSPRNLHTATWLNSGQVLVAGGQPSLEARASASAELYDPASNTWMPAPSMATGRVGHTATVLPSGRILISGGDPSGNVLVSGGPPAEGSSVTPSAELYSAP